MILELVGGELVQDGLSVGGDVGGCVMACGPGKGAACVQNANLP